MFSIVLFTFTIILCSLLLSPNTSAFILSPRSRHIATHFTSAHHHLYATIFNKNDQENGTEFRSNQKKKKNKKKKSTKWIACCSTKEVTKAIQMFVQEGDNVAELGSQLRESSTTICEQIGPNGNALLVDVERKFPNEKKGRQARTSAMRRNGDDASFIYRDRSSFREIQSFDHWREALFFSNNSNNNNNNNNNNDHQRASQYNVLVVDVSIVTGNDLDLTCISLIKEFLALNQAGDDDDQNPCCRTVIVKSSSLHDLARRLFHAQRLFAGVQTLEDCKFQNDSPLIIGTVGVEEYRRTIPLVVREGDCVIELGSHMGTSTNLLHQAARGQHDSTIGGGCIGVDVGPQIIKSAKDKFTEVPFEVGDAWKMAQLIRLKDKYFKNNTAENTYDAVYVDVGGLSGSDGLLEAISLISSISNCLEPRCIVIKSLCIRRLASNLVPFSEIWKKQSQPPAV